MTLDESLRLALNSCNVDGKLSCSLSITEQHIQFIPASKPYESEASLLKSKYMHVNAAVAVDESEQHITSGPENNQLRFRQPTPTNGYCFDLLSSQRIGPQVPPPQFQIYPLDAVKLTWEDSLRTSTGVGLNNLGNTCFLNSVLQVLVNTPPLVNYLHTDDHSRQACPSHVGYCAICALKQHIKRVHAAAKCRQDSLSPQFIVQKLRCVMKSHSFGRQQDAHEFLRYFVDAMQNASLHMFKDKKLDLFTKGTSAIGRIFGGFHKNDITCLCCRSVSTTFDPFLDISLEIKQFNNIEASLKHFTRLETLSSDNAYKCPKCCKKVSAHKSYTIHVPPNVLTFQLKRFDHFGKIDKNVGFPEKLNIRPYMSQKQGLPVNYKLYGVVVHAGRSTNSGHYYSFVRNPLDQWHLMDDSRVCAVNSRSVLQTAAYILFYVRVPLQMATVKPQPKVVCQPISPKLAKISAIQNGNSHPPAQPQSLISLSSVQSPPIHAVAPLSFIPRQVQPTVGNAKMTPDTAQHESHGLSDDQTDVASRSQLNANAASGDEAEASDSMEADVEPTSNRSENQLSAAQLEANAFSPKYSDKNPSVAVNFTESQLVQSIDETHKNNASMKSSSGSPKETSITHSDASADIRRVSTADIEKDTLSTKSNKLSSETPDLAVQGESSKDDLTITEEAAKQVQTQQPPIDNDFSRKKKHKNRKRFKSRIKTEDRDSVQIADNDTAACRTEKLEKRSRSPLSSRESVNSRGKRSRRTSSGSRSHRDSQSERSSHHKRRDHHYRRHNRHKRQRSISASLSSVERISKIDSREKHNRVARQMRDANRAPSSHQFNRDGIRFAERSTHRAFEREKQSSPDKCNAKRKKRSTERHEYVEKRLKRDSNEPDRKSMNRGKSKNAEATRRFEGDSRRSINERTSPAEMPRREKRREERRRKKLLRKMAKLERSKRDSAKASESATATQPVGKAGASLLSPLEFLKTFCSNKVKSWENSDASNIKCNNNSIYSNANAVQNGSRLENSYDDEYDAGRTKKTRAISDNCGALLSGCAGVNLFQKAQDVKYKNKQLF